MGATRATSFRETSCRPSSRTRGQGRRAPRTCGSKSMPLSTVISGVVSPGEHRRQPLRHHRRQRGDVAGAVALQSVDLVEHRFVWHEAASILWDQSPRSAIRRVATTKADPLRLTRSRVPDGPRPAHRRCHIDRHRGSARPNRLFDLTLAAVAERAGRRKRRCTGDGRARPSWCTKALPGGAHGAGGPDSRHGR